MGNRSIQIIQCIFKVNLVKNVICVSPYHRDSIPKCVFMISYFHGSKQYCLSSYRLLWCVMKNNWKPCVGDKKWSSDTNYTADPCTIKITLTFTSCTFYITLHSFWYHLYYIWNTNMAACLQLWNKSRKDILCLTNLGRVNPLSWE